MKIIILFMIVLMLTESVSATSISWSNIFLECGEGATFWECASLFFVPNLHVRAGKTLIWDSIWSIDEIYVGEITKAGNDFSESFLGIEDINDIFTFDFLGAIKNLINVLLVVFGLKPLAIWLYGIISGIIVYLLIISIEFVKNYLLISTMWLCWTIAIREITNWEFGGIGIQNTAIICGIIMIVGTIFILSFKWGDMILNVIGA